MSFPSSKSNSLCNFSFILQNEAEPSSFNPNVLHSHLQAEFQTSLSSPLEQGQFGLQYNTPQQIQELFQGYYLDYLSKNKIPISSVVPNSNVNQEYALVNVPITIPVKIPLRQDSMFENRPLSECIIEPPKKYEYYQPMLGYNQPPSNEKECNLKYPNCDNINERVYKLMNNPVPGISFNLLLSTVFNDE